MQGKPATLGGKYRRGMVIVPRKEVICANPNCKSRFLVERWKKTKFCSNHCAMRVIGGQPTSPRASRGKAGIRNDISTRVYFYSRWEANFARLMRYMIHKPVLRLIPIM